MWTVHIRAQANNLILARHTTCDYQHCNSVLNISDLNNEINYHLSLASFRCCCGCLRRAALEWFHMNAWEQWLLRLPCSANAKCSGDACEQSACDGSSEIQYYGYFSNGRKAYPRVVFFFSVLEWTFTSIVNLNSETSKTTVWYSTTTVHRLSMPYFCLVDFQWVWLARRLLSNTVGYVYLYIYIYWYVYFYAPTMLISHVTVGQVDVSGRPEVINACCTADITIFAVSPYRAYCVKHILMRTIRASEVDCLHLSIYNMYVYINIIYSTSVWRTHKEPFEISMSYTCQPVG